ncbi:S-layer homology domain-containing protein [Cohnella hongkongensis]|uniref:S-layer homology domain-containing protein n=1 Tax=Cohnella hongkongensis TaxID=178337 RepID=A0ABV9F8A2_9BACL
MEFKQRHKSSLFRLIALAMAVCMLSSAFLERAASAASSPADIRGGWSERVVLEWMDKGWLTGYPDGTVRPKLEVTRAEFFSLANKSLGFVDEAAISFSDAKQGNWKTKQAAIAVQAGYAEVYPDGTIQPDRKITREEVSVMVAKAFGLKLNPGETSAFIDAASISNAGKGAVGALVAAGILKGYPDGSFRPKKVITREEAVVILDGALKKLERGSDKDRTFSAAGTYGPASGTEKVAGNAVVTASGAILRNMEIQGDLLLSASIGEGEAVLDNVKVKGTVTVNGGGPNSIHLKDSELEILLVDKKNGNVRIVAAGSTLVKRVDLRSGARLESDADEGKGYEAVHLTKEMPAGSKAILKGEFAETNVASSNVEIELVEGTIGKMSVLPGASGNTLKLEDDARIGELTLEEETTVQGQGAIDRAIVGDRAKESKFERVPGKLEGGGVPAPSPGTGGGGNQDTTPPAAPVVDGVRDQGIYSGPVTPNWNDAPGTTSTATLTKDGSNKISYARNTEIAEDGSYILSVTARKDSNGARAVTTIRFTIDSAIAVPALIEGVEEGGTYASAIITWNDAPGHTSTATLAKDGAEAASFTYGTEISEDGEYALEVTTRKDSNGRTVRQQIAFTIDSVPPAARSISATGNLRNTPAGNAYYNIRLQWPSQVGTTSSAMLVKDGATAVPYVMDSLIDQNGDYELTVTWTKLSNGLTASTTREFKVDVGPVGPILSGFTNNGIYFEPVTMSWEPYEGTSIDWNRLTNAETGERFDDIASPTTVEHDGTYEFTAGMRNSSNEIKTYAYKFVITGIRGVTAEGVYGSAMPDWVEPIGFDNGYSEATLSKDGGPAAPYTKGTEIVEDGEYVLAVTWHTSDDHSASQSVRFNIHSEQPEAVTVTGVENGGTYVSVTPTWQDEPGMTSTATLAKDGGEAEAFASGAEISEDGEYVLEVTTRKDSNGLAVRQRIAFTIDSAPPAEATITIDGSTRELGGESVYYSASLTWTEPTGTTSTATLRKDGAEPVQYTTGTLIDQDGDYELIVTTTKQSNGLTSTAVKEFKVNVGPARPVLSGFSDNAILFGPIEMSWTPHEGTQIEGVRLVHKNKGINYLNLRSPMTLEEIGEFVFYVNVREGEETLEYEYKFMIAEIRGVEEGEVSASVTPAWYEPQYFGEVEAVTLTKDGGAPRPHLKGETIDEPGEYVLTVTWRIDGGNSTSQSVRFTIVEAPPAPDLSGFSDNAILFGPAEIAWTPREGTQIDHTTLRNRTVNSFRINPTSPILLDEAAEYEFSVIVSQDGVTGRYDYSFILAEIRGVEEGGVYASATPDWFEPQYFGEAEAALAKDGGSPLPYAKGEIINEPGEYVLTVTWRTDAGNSESKSIRFAIDSRPPAPQLTGFSDILFKPAEIAWAPREGTQIEWSDLWHRNINSHYSYPSSPTTIDVAGEYVLSFRVSDGQESTRYDYQFIVAEIRGIEEGGVYTTASARWYEPQYFGEVEAVLTKDGGSPRPYLRGATINEVGEYVLTVTWRTDSGHSESMSIRFTIVPVPPAPHLSGVSDHAILFAPAEISWAPSEGTQIASTILYHRNRNFVISNLSNPTTIHEAGEYELTVIVNQDGVTGEHKFPFMLVEIRGIEEGGVYASATPEWYEPQYFGEVEAALAKDGGSPIPYAKGEAINEPGEYVLTVTWRTDAGNSESKSIRFTIVGEAPEAPTIDLNGEPNGSNYYSVTPSWTDAEGTTSTATLTRTWDEEPPVTSPYERGTRIEEEGDYVLTVTTTRISNGLTAATTVRFTVTDQVP